MIRWRLESSRETFGLFTRTDTDRSFWAQLTEELREAGEYSGTLGDPSLVAYVSPGSNCRDLEAKYKSVVAALPEAWRRLAENVYVGRTLDCDTNAGAMTSGSGAYIDVSWQYSVAIGPYLAAFDHFLYALKEGYEAATSDDETIASMILEELENEYLYKPIANLETLKGFFSRQDIIAMADERFVESPMGNYEDRLPIVLVRAERFILGHELGHLLLGHSDDHGEVLPEVADARIQTDGLVDKFGLRESFDGSTPSPRQELEADVFGFLCLTQSLTEGASVSSIRDAIFGSFFSLLSVSHVNSHIFVEQLDADETHPDLAQRFQALMRLVTYAAWDLDVPLPEHPLMLMLQMESFLRLIIRTQMQRSDSGEVDRPNLISKIAEIIEKERKLRAGIDSRGKLLTSLQAANDQAKWIMDAMRPTETDLRVGRVATGDWSVSLLDNLIASRIGECAHIRQDHLQPAWVFSWERVFRCAACHEKHLRNNTMRMAQGRYVGLGQFEEKICDRCRRYQRRALTPAYMRLNHWMLMFSVCDDCNTIMEIERKRAVRRMEREKSSLASGVADSSTATRPTK